MSICRPLAKHVILTLLSTFKGTPPKGTILTYHSIDESGSAISVSPQAFKAQMRYLKEQGYRSLSLKQAFGDKTAGSTSEKTFVLSFDDGYRNFYCEAYPVLEACGFTATVFIVTRHVGALSTWCRREGVPALSLMPWLELTELSRLGIDIQPHSRTHPQLPLLRDAELHEEIAGSKVDIEDRLGYAADYFCYPYGELDDGVVRAVKEAGFKGAVTVLFGWNPPLGRDLYRLRRVSSDHFTSMLAFRMCLTGQYDRYRRFRELVNVLRKRRECGMVMAGALTLPGFLP